MTTGSVLFGILIFLCVDAWLWIGRAQERAPGTRAPLYFFTMTLAPKHFGESEFPPQKRCTSELFESDERKDSGNIISRFKLMNCFILSMFSAQSIHCVIRLGIRMDSYSIDPYSAGVLRCCNPDG